MFVTTTVTTSSLIANLYFKIQKHVMKDSKSSTKIK